MVKLLSMKLHLRAADLKEVTSQCTSAAPPEVIAAPGDGA